ncbi:hypothetical protein DH2020_021157 [Rehmannia glutinosa]|uniref:Uncharacterized protein n=1 Tax=Rehmannia glutinosa TaxID=99300 RepID=A0ABR0WA99_REHGL
MAKSSVSLKLLIDKQAKRVLFAEAGKECVDFYFTYSLCRWLSSLLCLEKKKQEMVGSLSNLYQSIENLHDSYIQPNQTKHTLLKPVSSVSGSVPLLAINDAPATERKYYRCTCNHFGIYVSDDNNANCPNCKNKMTINMYYVAPPAVCSSSEGGFVKGVVTYMVMNDLAVMSLSTISSITLLNKFNVKDLDALEEKVVTFGKDEAVKLLKASLETKNVLTHVFLNGNKCYNIIN